MAAVDTGYGMSCAPERIGVVYRYCLSQHPEADEKVAAELDSHGLLATQEQPEPRPVMMEDLGKLTYLSCCIKVEFQPAAT